MKFPCNNQTIKITNIIPTLISSKSDIQRVGGDGRCARWAPSKLGRVRARRGGPFSLLFRKRVPMQYEIMRREARKKTARSFRPFFSIIAACEWLLPAAYFFLKGCEGGQYTYIYTVDSLFRNASRLEAAATASAGKRGS